MKRNKYKQEKLSRDVKFHLEDWLKGHEQAAKAVKAILQPVK